MSLKRRRALKSAGIAGVALTALVILLLTPASALADAAAEAAAEREPGERREALRDELEFILNTFAFLVWGALVMWMCAGFTMLESGAVRTKNASMICLKNIGIYSIAGLAFYVIGYNLMYGDGVRGWFDSFDLFYGPSDAEKSLLGLSDEEKELLDPSVYADMVSGVVSNGYSVMSDWFFQMVFVATAASIVSGAIAERIKMWAFFAFTLILTAFIYPVVGSWHWGEGWLADRGFVDFAGSTIVHSTGGWAALAGLLIIGPRLGKYRKDGSVKPTPPSNVLVVTLGVLILWLGWFGFNGGSQLALGTAKDAVAMSNVLVNTNLAAAAGVVAALIISRPVLGRMDLFAGLNGAIAGLVSITAAPDITNHLWAIFIGAVGGLMCTLAIKWLEKIKIDDVVGAIPAHLVCGIWGTMAATLTGPAKFHIQLLGVVVIGVFVFVVSLVVWKLLDMAMGLRVSTEAERLGQDTAELGIETYPEFVLMPEEFDED